jgi:hypothetical protein
VVLFLSDCAQMRPASERQLPPTTDIARDRRIELVLAHR